ncbi:hypothetical protein D4R87_03345 [bacterium]|nr:MAG: hypothetical protein D4R87_03345 [bacterium]
MLKLIMVRYGQRVLAEEKVQLSLLDCLYIKGGQGRKNEFARSRTNIYLPSLKATARHGESQMN